MNSSDKLTPLTSGGSGLTILHKEGYKQYWIQFMHGVLGTWLTLMIRNLRWCKL